MVTLLISQNCHHDSIFQIILYALIHKAAFRLYLAFLFITQQFQFYLLEVKVLFREQFVCTEGVYFTHRECNIVSVREK